MFTDIFVRILHDKQLTPYKVAKETGISQGLMNEYARGMKVPSMKNLTKIANFLEVPIDTFTCEDTDDAVNQIPTSPIDALTKKERKTIEKLIKDRAMISNYSELSERDQKMVNDIISLFADRKRKT